MATTIYGMTSSYVSWWFPTVGATPIERDVVYEYPYPQGGEVPIRYRHKAWDSVAGDWVFWFSDYKETNAKEYPGPGVFGVDTLDYAVEAVVYGRFELT